MEKREQIIRLWFDLWLRKEELGIDGIFAPDACYIESWGPEYHGIEAIRHWFREWNTRGTVLRWEIRQFIHQGDQTVVEWYFQCQMAGSQPQAFDGVSLTRWTPQGRIALLKEFGCNIDRYDPYRDGPQPRFLEQKASRF